MVAFFCFFFSFVFCSYLLHLDNKETEISSMTKITQLFQSLSNHPHNIFEGLASTKLVNIILC